MGSSVKPGVRGSPEPPDPFPSGPKLAPAKPRLFVHAANAALDDGRVLPTVAAHGCPTKSAQSGARAFGAFDLSGNLKEWTSTQTSPGAYNIRGGSNDTPSGGLACDFDFVSASSTFTFANLGFRCCADP